MSLTKFIYEVPFEKVDAKYYNVIIFAENEGEAKNILTKYLDEGLEGEFPEFFVKTLETEVDRDKIELVEQSQFDETNDKDDLETQKDLLDSIENPDYEDTEDSESDDDESDDENEKKIDG